MDPGRVSVVIRDRDYQARHGFSIEVVTEASLGRRDVVYTSFLAGASVQIDEGPGTLLLHYGRGYWRIQLSDERVVSRQTGVIRVLDMASEPDAEDALAVARGAFDAPAAAAANRVPVSEGGLAAPVGRAAVGRHLKVWWSDDAAWYRGAVSDFDGEKHTIDYDDGEQEVLVLAEERYEFIDDAEGFPEEGGSDDGGYDGRGQRRRRQFGAGRLQRRARARAARERDWCDGRRDGRRDRAATSLRRARARSGRLAARRRSEVQLLAELPEIPAVVLDW